MRAAFLESEGRLVLAQVATPTIQAAGQVLIQTKAAGICGWEVHALEGTHPFRKAPVILGHEASGVVILDPGDDVVILAGQRYRENLIAPIRAAVARSGCRASACRPIAHWNTLIQ